MSPVVVTLAIVGGTVTVIGTCAAVASVGIYVGCKVEDWWQRRNTPTAARVHPLNVPGVRRALDQAASRDNLR